MEYNVASGGCNETTDRILTILTDQLNLTVPTPQTDLIGEGILDSLALVDLIMHLEGEFGFAVEPDQLELDNFQTVERIGQMVLQSTAELAKAAV